MDTALVGFQFAEIADAVLICVALFGGIILAMCLQGR